MEEPARYPWYDTPAMSTPTGIGTLIVRSPDIRGGRPRVASTGVTVRRIVGWYKLGLNAEEIADRIGHITVGQVFAALAYYHANRYEIDADLTAEDALTETLERQHGIGSDIPG
jgi:uncharacterized protein (DUF433 family)